MKIPKIFLVLMCLPFISCSQSNTKTNSANSSPTVIELFTSEGCSSCPPADDLVAKIQKEYQNKPIYILAYHVDYWDRLGWKDAFSDAAYSKRQYKYASWMKGNFVYSPQIVVNGSTQFVGSDAARLRSELGKKSSLASDEIKLTTLKLASQKIKVDFTLASLTKNTSLNIALIEDHATTEVKRGENSDKTLHHVDIVRAFKTIDPEKNGSITFNLPKDLSAGYHIVAFLQDNNSGKILSAARN